MTQNKSTVLSESPGIANDQMECLLRRDGGNANGENMWCKLPLRVKSQRGSCTAYVQMLNTRDSGDDQENPSLQ